VNLDEHPLFLPDEGHPERPGVTVEKIQIAKLVNGQVVRAPDTWDAEAIMCERDIVEIWGGGIYTIRALGHKPKRPNQVIVANRERFTIGGDPKVPAWQSATPPGTAPPGAPSSLTGALGAMGPTLAPVLVATIAGFFERSSRSAEDRQQREREDARRAQESHQATMMMMLQMAQQQQAAQAAQMQMMMTMAKETSASGSPHQVLELGMKLASVLASKGADGEAINWGDTLSQFMQTVQMGLGAAVQLKGAAAAAAPPPGYEPVEDNTANGAAMPEQEAPPAYAPSPLHS
jgi:hypothetical protein